MGITFVHANVHGVEEFCSTWLCLNPARSLGTAGYGVHYMSVKDFVEKKPLDEVIVVERVLWNGRERDSLKEVPEGPIKSVLSEFADLRVLDTIEYAQSKGCKVIAIFDDHYEAYPVHKSFNRPSELWRDGAVMGRSLGFVPLEDFRRGLALVDGVVTPSKFLCQHYGKYAKLMFHVHNRPLLSQWSTINSLPRDDGRLVVGWSGTAQHYHTWYKNEAVLGALSKLRDKIVLRGVIPMTVAKMMTGYGIDVEAVKPVAMDEFQNVVASYDIGICPLRGEYDKGRSWIKWLECSLMGKPVVASPLADAYAECRGGYVVKDDTLEEWIVSLSWLLNDDTRQAKAAEGLSWAWRQGLDENLDEWLMVFKAVRGD